jgi:hypothetical protein
MQQINLDELLIKNDSLFNHLHVINQEFDILPKAKHYGMAINFTDLQERRADFLSELINTTLDWVYSQSNQERIIGEYQKAGRTQGNAYSALQRSAFEKFRRSDDGKLLQGQFGELLLSNCIQRFFGAVPILRKMPITTSAKIERFGADAIHYKPFGDKHSIYIGEAKSYTSDYKFNQALESAINSILATYSGIQNELRSYVHEGFLEKELEEIATGLVYNTLTGVRYHLIAIIAYNETKKRNGVTEEEIKLTIEKIIRDRYSGFDKGKIDLQANAILQRITYIVFPVWKLEQLIVSFAKSLPYQD